MGLSDKSTLYFALKGQFSGFLQEVNISSGLIQIQESLFFLSLLLVVMRSYDVIEESVKDIKGELGKIQQQQKVCAVNCDCLDKVWEKIIGGIAKSQVLTLLGPLVR